MGGREAAPVIRITDARFKIHVTDLDVMTAAQPAVYFNNSVSNVTLSTFHFQASIPTFFYELERTGSH